MDEQKEFLKAIFANICEKVSEALKQTYQELDRSSRSITFSPDDLESLSKSIVGNLQDYLTREVEEVNARASYEKRIELLHQQIAILTENIRQQTMDKREIAGELFELKIYNRDLSTHKTSADKCLVTAQSEVTRLQAQVTLLQQRRIHVCVSCWENPIDVINTPCNHAVMCSTCVDRFKETAVHRTEEGLYKCPNCRQGVHSFQRIFLGITNVE